MNNDKHVPTDLKFASLILLIGLLVPASAIAGDRSMVVNVTAYNSVHGQTKGNPKKAAWGDKLRPGMRVVAVSRDLIPLGLTRGTKVAIQGFKKDFKVWDKMGPGVKRTIDIYMGKHVHKARKFGRKRLRIWWYDKKHRGGRHSAR